MNRYRFLPPVGIVALMAGTLAAVLSQGVETKLALAGSEAATLAETAEGAASAEIFIEPPSQGFASIFA